MPSKHVRIAIATTGNKRLEDQISHEFGHSNTFTIVEIDDGNIKDVKTIDNPAVSLSHGRGPVVVKHLADMGTNIVVSGEIGPGASTMLEELKITTMIADPGKRVGDFLREKALIG